MIKYDKLVNFIFNNYLFSKYQFFKKIIAMKGYFMIFGEKVCEKLVVYFVK